MALSVCTWSAPTASTLSSGGQSVAWLIELRDCCLSMAQFPARSKSICKGILRVRDFTLHELPDPPVSEVHRSLSVGPASRSRNSPMHKIRKTVGIDLGTTNSVIAVLDPTDSVILTGRDEAGHTTFPSLVGYEDA